MGQCVLISWDKKSFEFGRFLSKSMTLCAVSLWPMIPLRYIPCFLMTKCSHDSHDGRRKCFDVLVKCEILQLLYVKL